MDSGKYLTLREARNELLKCENQLELYLHKKKINFLKTQPKATDYDKVMIQGTPISFDKFTQYIIKDDEVDSKIYSLRESILAYQTYILKEEERMSKYDEIGLIRYLKEEIGMSWKEIDKRLNCGIGGSRKKMQRYYGRI